MTEGSYGQRGALAGVMRSVGLLLLALLIGLVVGVFIVLIFTVASFPITGVLDQVPSDSPLRILIGLVFVALVPAVSAAVVLSLTARWHDLYAILRWLTVISASFRLVSALVVAVTGDTDARVGGINAAFYDFEHGAPLLYATALAVGAVGSLVAVYWSWRRERRHQEPSPLADAGSSGSASGPT